MAEGAEGAQLWHCDDWQHGMLPASHAWAGSTAAPPPHGASGMQHAELASPLDCSPPASCVSHAPPRLLCSSPPALISTAALLPASPTARPLGMGFPAQLRHYGYSTPFGGGHGDAAGAQPPAAAAAAAAAADEHPRVPVPDAAEQEGITMRSGSMPSIGSPAAGVGGGLNGGGTAGRSMRLVSSHKVGGGSMPEEQPSPQSGPARVASGDTSKDSSDTPKAKNSRSSCSVDVPSQAPATSSGVPLQRQQHGQQTSTCAVHDSPDCHDTPRLLLTCTGHDARRSGTHGCHARLAAELWRCRTAMHARLSMGILHAFAGCGDTDPLDQVAQLHAHFLTPNHLRKGKGGRQPAVSAKLQPRICGTGGCGLAFFACCSHRECTQRLGHACN